MLNILMISQKDQAGSGKKICESIEKIGGIRIRLLIAEPHQFKYKYDYLLRDFKDKSIYKLFENIDIIHFKGDQLPRNFWNGIILPECPYIVTVGGSGFRRNEKNTHEIVAKQWNSIESYVQNTVFRTAITPDLNYENFYGEWSPHPIDCKEFENTFKLGEKLKIIHSPSNKFKKGTNEYILPAIELLKANGFDFEFELIENLSNEDCINKKKNANLIIDQIFDTGFYGMNAVEAMAYGIPVMAYISDEAIQQSDNKLNNCPVINVKKSIKEVYEKLKYFIENPEKLIEISKQTKEYCNKIHSFETNGKYWIQKYNEIYQKYKDKINYFNINEIKSIKFKNIVDMKVKLKIIKNTINGFELSYKIGQIVELPEQVAEQYVKKGLAIEFNETKTDIETKEIEQVKIKEEKEIIETKEFKTDIETKKRGRKPRL